MKKLSTFTYFLMVLLVSVTAGLFLILITQLIFNWKLIF